MKGQLKRSKSDINLEENYIIRVYRTPENAEHCKNPQLVGLIEDIEHGRCTTFHNLDELWAILAK